MIIHNRAVRKASGGRYRAYRGKKLYEKGNNPTNSKLGEPKIKVEKVKFAHYKIRVVQGNEVNVAVNNLVKKVKILAVLENSANSEFVRRNIITKGAIVDTELGKVKITSRPGQHGTLNGKLIEPKESEKQDQTKNNTKKNKKVDVKESNKNNTKNNTKGEKNE